MLTEILRRHRYVPAEPAERQSRGHKRHRPPNGDSQKNQYFFNGQRAANLLPPLDEQSQTQAQILCYRYAEAVTQIRSTTRIGTACVVHDHDEQYHERRKNDSKDKMNGTTNMTGVSTKGTLTGVTTKGTVTDQHNERHGTMNCG